MCPDIKGITRILLICDIYGPLPLCKVIREEDKRRLSCGHIFGFVGKDGTFPALMDSARARLHKTQTSAGRVATQALSTRDCPLWPSLRSHLRNGRQAEHIDGSAAVTSFSGRELPPRLLCDTPRHWLTVPRQYAHSCWQSLRSRYSSLGAAPGS